MTTTTTNIAATATPTAQVVEAPQRPAFIRQRSVFLAGTTTATKTEPDWREGVIRSLSHLPITIFNPIRRDWGKDWVNDIAHEQFRLQCEWELDAQDKADVVAIYFGRATDAPISLLEFGLSVRSGRAVVCCPKGYSKRGNVQVVGVRYGATVVETLEELATAVEKKLRLP